MIFLKSIDVGITKTTNDTNYVIWMCLRLFHNSLVSILLKLAEIKPDMFIEVCPVGVLIIAHQYSW